VTEAAASAVVEKVEPWLSQGDVFTSVLIVRAGVAKGAPVAGVDKGPALLISHGCAIDKKTNSGKSKLEYLSFLPIQDVVALPSERAERLRASSGNVQPYEAMYLGSVPEVGEGYVTLTQPYTLPAVLLRTELREFTAEETGDAADHRIVATISDSRAGRLTDEALELFYRKWTSQWTRRDIVVDEPDRGEP